MGAKNLFQIPRRSRYRVFLSRQVRNKQGTEELFEISINLSSRVHCMRSEASLSKDMVPQTFLKGTVK